MRWDANARDWAAQEEMEEPRYQAALASLGVRQGDRLLDVGCGSGVFLALAAGTGATVAGVDAAPGLLEIARRRVPSADLRHADLLSLPFGDASFEIVTGFNAFFFAADMVEALREARRVLVPAGRVLVQVWGNPDHCDLKLAIAAASALAGAAAPPNPLWRDGVLEDLLRQAGLAAADRFTARVPLVYPDSATLLARVLAPPPMTAAVLAAGEAAVREAVLAALDPFRQADGSYRLHNEWVYVIGRTGATAQDDHVRASVARS